MTGTRLPTSTSSSGRRRGPGGARPSCNALSSRLAMGIPTLLAVVTPNLVAKPATVLFNKVTIKGATQAVQMFGPAQAAVTRRWWTASRRGSSRRTSADEWFRLVGVFIHWEADDDTKIYPVQLQGHQGIDRARLEGTAEDRRGHQRRQDGEASLRGAAPKADRRGAGFQGSTFEGRGGKRPSTAFGDQLMRKLLLQLDGSRLASVFSIKSWPTTPGRTR